MAKITFSTRDFERSHGRRPSRTAAGSWAFCFDRDDTPWFAPGMLTLSEAQTAARGEALKRNAYEVRVQP